MEELILTSLSKNELKELIKDCIKEVLIENAPSDKLQDENTLLSIKEASKILNLSQQTIYGYTSQNLIPFSKKGKSLYFLKSELIEWVKEGRRKTYGEIEKEAALYLSKPRVKW